MTNTVHVNVGGTWKTATNYYVNVGGTWKTGSAIGPNVSSAWKGFITNLVSTNLKLHLDAGDSDSYIGSGATWIDLITGNTARSVDFDGTDDELKVTNSNSDFQFGTGDFTVELFVKYDVGPSSSASRYILDMRSSAGTSNAAFLANAGRNSDYTKIEWGLNSTAILEVTHANYISAGTWNHIAIARSGSTIKMFINGTEVDSATDNTNYSDDPADITIGDRYSNSASSQWLNGKISNLRIVKGTAVYTSAFTPSIDPLTNITNTKLLCCNKSSTTGSTVTPGTITANSSPTVSISNPFGNKRSVDFDGTDDKLSIPDSTDFEFGSGDFTIEAWVKQENAAGSANTMDHTIVNKWDNTSNAKEWILRIQGDYLQWLQTTDGSTNQITTGNTVINAGQWYHVAVVGHSGTIKLFVNGTQQSSTGTQGTINSHSNPLIFGYNESTNSSWMDGLMSNCRIVKGTAIYTSSFTPPTGPLTNITNTKFLGLNNSNVTDYTVSPGDITVSSSPTASTINPFGADGTISGATYSSSDGGILDFDGTDDYVSVDSSSDFTFGTGDFTVECWVKPDDFGSRGTLYDSRPSNGSTGITIGHESSSGEIRVYMSATSGSDIVVQSSDFETGEWQHIAVTRSSGTVSLFINGVSKDTGTRTTDLNNTNAVNIGYKTYTSSSYTYFDGKIAQVRVYKGTGLTSTQVTENYNATKSTFGL